MKPEDFHDDDHEMVHIEPSLRKDTDTLKAMFDSLVEAHGHALTHMQVISVHDNPKIETQNISDDLVMASLTPGNFRGLKFCPICTRKARMFFQDMVRILEEMDTEIERHLRAHGKKI